MVCSCVVPSKRVLLQSRSQSFVPLDQRSENESSRSIHFQITMEITEFCISSFTAQCAVCIYGIYGACLNGCSQSSRFPNAGQGERSSGNENGIAANNSLLVRNRNHVLERKMTDRFPKLPDSD